MLCCPAWRGIGLRGRHRHGVVTLYKSHVPVANGCVAPRGVVLASVGVAGTVWSPCINHTCLLPIVVLPLVVGIGLLGRRRHGVVTLNKSRVPVASGCVALFGVVLASVGAAGTVWSPCINHTCLLPMAVLPRVASYWPPWASQARCCHFE